jgi:ABC-type uncharacterized transport system substrate-binding protein
MTMTKTASAMPASMAPSALFRRRRVVAGAGVKDDLGVSSGGKSAVTFLSGVRAAVPAALRRIGRPEGGLFKLNLRKIGLRHFARDKMPQAAASARSTASPGCASVRRAMFAFRTLPAAGMLAALIAFAPVAAEAHPHVFIKQQVVALFDATGISGFRLTWRFDPMYSSMMRADFVAAKEGALTPADVKSLHDKCFIDLKDEHYFTTITFNGKPLPFGEPAAFSAKSDGDSIIYSFTLPLKPAPDLKRAQNAVAITVFDPSYYVYYELAADHPVATEGGSALGASCVAKAVWRPSIGWGTVHSDLVTCTYHAAAP